MAPKTSINSEVLNLLKRIGLNQYESKIYTALLASGSSTAGGLSEFADVPRSRVYDVLTSLEKKGFSIIQIGRPVKYSAVPLENAIGQVRTTYEDEFKKRVESVNKLEKDLKSVLREHIDKKKEKTEAPEDVVGILKGKNSLYNHIKHMISNSDKSILKITNEDGMASLDKHCRGAIMYAKKKGIDMRIITNAQGNLKNFGLKDAANIRTSKGVEGRFLVKDGKEVVLVTSPEDVGLWIKSPYLAGCLENLFEHAWEKSKNIGE